MSKNDGHIDLSRQILIEVRDMAADVSVLKDDVAELKRDMIFVKSAIVAFSGDVDDHETRIQTLENQAA